MWRREVGQRVVTSCTQLSSRVQRWLHTPSTKKCVTEAVQEAIKGYRCVKEASDVIKCIYTVATCPNSQFTQVTAQVVKVKKTVSEKSG